MTQDSPYTFGDSELAKQRLLALSRAYEPATRDFLARFAPARPRRALDLGCGPGYSTRLLHAATGAEATLGLDLSSAYLDDARTAEALGISFVEHDLRKGPPPLERFDLVFERFLLTHLSDPAARLREFASLLRPGGRLLVLETSRLESAEPALSRYYELVGALQAHYGQRLYVGRELGDLARTADLYIAHFEEVVFEQAGAVMAELHAMNLRTWSRDAAAQQLFDAAELGALERELTALAEGSRACPAVRVGTGQLVVLAD